MANKVPGANKDDLPLCLQNLVVDQFRIDWSCKSGFEDTYMRNEDIYINKWVGKLIWKKNYWKEEEVAELKRLGLVEKQLSIYDDDDIGIEAGSITAHKINRNHFTDNYWSDSDFHWYCDMDHMVLGSVAKLINLLDPWLFPNQSITSGLKIEVNEVGDGCDIFQGTILYVDRVKVKKAFRGHGLGLFLLDQMHKIINGNSSLCLLIPYPLQYLKHDADRSNFEEDRNKLMNYYRALGFRMLKTNKSTFMGRWNDYTTPTFKAALAKYKSNFPHQEGQKQAVKRAPKVSGSNYLKTAKKKKKKKKRKKKSNFPQQERHEQAVKRAPKVSGHKRKSCAKPRKPAKQPSNLGLSSPQCKRILHSLSRSPQNITSYLLDECRQELIAQRRQELITQRKEVPAPQCKGSSCELLEKGDRVYVVKEKPTSIIDGRRLAGKFRATDLRWGTQVHTIVKVVVRGGSPPLYKVNGINAMFPREQLKLSSKVPAGKEKAVAGRFVPSKIVDKKKIKGRVHYRIRWKDYQAKDDTWEPHSKFNKDRPDLVKAQQKTPQKSHSISINRTHRDASSKRQSKIISPAINLTITSSQKTSNEPSLNAARVMVRQGKHIMKNFPPNGIFLGTLKSVETEEKTGKILYHIKYDDGDEEDLHWEEFVDLLTTE